MSTDVRLAHNQPNRLPTLENFSFAFPLLEAGRATVVLRAEASGAQLLIPIHENEARHLLSALTDALDDISARRGAVRPSQSEP